MKVPDFPERQPGHYLGTVIAGKWWNRYMQHGFFARGNGVYWLDAEGFCFLRHLTGRPLVIPYALVVDVKIGRGHAGRWQPGPGGVLKLVWEYEEKQLSSGFVVSRVRQETEKIVAGIRKRIT